MNVLIATDVAQRGLDIKDAGVQCRQRFSYFQECSKNRATRPESVMASCVSLRHADSTGVRQNLCRPRFATIDAQCALFRVTLKRPQSATESWPDIDYRSATCRRNGDGISTKCRLISLEGQISDVDTTTHVDYVNVGGMSTNPPSGQSNELEFIGFGAWGSPSIWPDLASRSSGLEDHPCSRRFSTWRSRI